MCGVHTHIVTAVSVTPSSHNDSPELPGLCRTTAKRFELVEVSADKAYLSKVNVAEIEDHGATPFIPFKSNSVEPAPGSPWARMYHRFAYESDTWMARYHKRSNVETTFSMIKRKFGDTLKGKTDAAQDNEVLTKIVAHNLCCLIQAHYELGITPSFAEAS